MVCASVPWEGSFVMSFTPEFRKHAAKRKRQTHCKAGHPFTPENTREEVSVRGAKKYVMRTCKACEREREMKKRRSL